MVFGLLVAEIVAFLLLVAPFPFAMRKSFLNWISTSSLVANVAYAIKILIIFVLVLFVDAVMRLKRADEEARHGHHDPRILSDLHARKFYAQRNMYLTGFTLFLSLILWRTFSLIHDLLKNEQRMLTVQKQAENQSKEYNRLTDEASSLKKKSEELEQELIQIKSKSRDVEILKKQAEQQAAAYMELADKYNELERKAGKDSSERSKDK